MPDSVCISTLGVELFASFCCFWFTFFLLLLQRKSPQSQKVCLNCCQHQRQSIYEYKRLPVALASLLNIKKHFQRKGSWYKWTICCCPSEEEAKTTTPPPSPPPTPPQPKAPAPPEGARRLFAVAAAVLVLLLLCCCCCCYFAYAVKSEAHIILKALQSLKIASCVRFLAYFRSFVWAGRSNADASFWRPRLSPLYSCKKHF